MTDTQKPAQNAPQSAPMPNFNLGAQYIKDLSFEGPAHPGDVVGNEPPKIDVNVTAQTRPLDETVFEVVLNLRAEAKINDKHAFLIELAYAGIVSVASNLPEENLRYILLAEAPRMLFPFARNIVANATRDGGFPPLMLQPIDFNALYAQQHAEVNKPAAGNA